MIGVTITEAELRDHGACADGLARFLEDFPGGMRVPEWTQQHAIVWLAWTRCALTVSDRAWAVERGIVPRANLYGANLSRAYLCGANLSGADLTRADLYGANLCGANLSGANLTGAYRPDGKVPEGWDRANGYLTRRPA